MPAIIDGSSGFAPGRTSDGAVDVVQMPACTLVEVLNLSGDNIWVALNPPSDTFVAAKPGCQVVRAGEYIEIPTTGTPKVCVRGAGSNDYQVRKLA